MRVNRRDFVKLGAVVGAGLTIPAWTRRALAEALAPALSDPALQPKFVNPLANALAPSFRFLPDSQGRFTVSLREASQHTGLLRPNGQPVATRVWGYGDYRGPTWPGRTFEVRSVSAGGSPDTLVRWENDLFGKDHLLPVDSSLHWAFSLPGFEGRSIARDGVPIVTHLHGGHTDFQYDGNPEFFYTPGNTVVGPRWAQAPGGFTNLFRYDNDVPAGSLWYHDHALGITRLNVYAGLAGFYFVRDELDTGLPDNPLGLPAYPYEMALAIQDRMFRTDGALFYPAFPGDPFWEDFITGEGLADDEVPQPSALAEFFGDHMVVNGRIWPKADVERRSYRLRLLNGCDSRFLVLRFRPAAPGATGLAGAGSPLPFHVIGSDQGLSATPTRTDTLVVEPGGRYDVVVDFSQVSFGTRVIVENQGGDAPFGGDFGDALAPEDLFPDRQTDRIMAFDVSVPRSDVPDRFVPRAVPEAARARDRGRGQVDRVRRVALFEGNDEFGRLQPLLGTAEPTRDAEGNLVNGTLAWFLPTTENPELGATEDWEIFNATGDAHPIHLHLVNFRILERRRFTADLVEQPLLQHNGTTGVGFRLEDVRVKGVVQPGPAYVEDAPKDMVTALPGQVVRIRATFDKPGRYVWHCHILSHEDHEMMRVLHVGPGA